MCFLTENKGIELKEQKLYKLCVQAKEHNHRLNGENYGSNTLCGLVKG